MKKVLKIVGIIVLVVIVLFLIHTLRNFIIIKGLQDSFSKYETSNNYYIKSIANESENVTMTINYYKKDNNQVTFMERKMNDEIIKVAMYDNGERVDVFTDNGKEKTFRVNTTGSSMPTVEIVNYFHTDNNWQIILMSALARIKKENLNQRECYVLKNVISPDLLYFEDSNNVLYIEKETGLCIKTITGNIITEREYEFDKVDDSIFAEPDISQYKLLEN